MFNILHGTKKRNKGKGLETGAKIPFRSAPIGISRQTPAQRRVPRKHFFGDWDKDGVINRLDCQPRNPKKHDAYPMGAPMNYHQNPYSEGVRWQHRQARMVQDPEDYKRDMRKRQDSENPDGN